jgi:FkbM family methyltransferase
MWRLTRSNRVQIFGHDMRVDPLDSLALAKGWYEPDETSWYEANVGAGEFIVEAGANIGVFTLLIARLVGPSGRVLTFEPDPALRGILEENIARNGYANVTVRGAAVAEEPGETTFFRASANQGDNRLFSHDGEDGATFQVSVVTLDEELAGQPRVDLLKMDIQGAEVLALRGLRKTLAENPPRTIMMEFWPYGIAGMGGDARTVVEELLGYGYLVTELGSQDPYDLDAGLDEMTVENQKWVNLVFRHSEGDAR